MQGVFLNLMFNILGNQMIYNNLLFLPERMKIEKVKKLAANSYDEN